MKLLRLGLFKALLLLFVTGNCSEATSLFTRSTTFPGIGRSLGCATSVGTKILFAGCHTILSPYSDAVAIYDYSTDSWTKASLSKGASSLACASAGTEALFANNDITGVVDIFDYATGTWLTSSTSVKIFIAGGSTATSWSSVVDIYDTNSGLLECYAVSILCR